MHNKLINLAGYLDGRGLEKEAIAVKSLIPLFVYGTLKKGEKNHHRLDGSDFLKQEKLFGFKRSEGIGPAIMPGGEDDLVEGELYQVDSEVLDKIDEYEGDEYIRELVELDDGSEAYAYIYVPIEGIEPEDIHNAANEAGIRWDDNEKFMDKTEDLVGKRHLDDMTEKELHKVIREIKTNTF